MTFGEKLKKLRNEAGLTQKDLADKMNVSFQTVSKWESDLNEPDIGNIKELCKVFGCSFESLLGDGEEKTNEATPKDEGPKKIGVCRDCKKDLFEGDQYHTFKKQSPSGEDVTALVCEECHKKNEEKLDSQVAAIHNEIKDMPKTKQDFKKAAAKKEDSKILTWAIVIGIIALVVSLIVCIVFNAKIGIALTICLPIIFGYVALADIYCLFSGTWITEVFTSIAGWSIKTPGIIFSFSWDGLKFLIAMKILFWVLGMAVGLGVFLLALGLSSVFSIFSFPFILINNKKELA